MHIYSRKNWKILRKAIVDTSTFIEVYTLEFYLLFCIENVKKNMSLFGYHYARHRTRGSSVRPEICGIIYHHFTRQIRWVQRITMDCHDPIETCIANLHRKMLREQNHSLSLYIGLPIVAAYSKTFKEWLSAQNVPMHSCENSAENYWVIFFSPRLPTLCYFSHSSSFSFQFINISKWHLS